jgi:hypothetical protein
VSHSVPEPLQRGAYRLGAEAVEERCLKPIRVSVDYVAPAAPLPQKELADADPLTPIVLLDV